MTNSEKNIKIDPIVTGFIQNHKTELIQIYINERIKNDNQDGMLLLTKVNEEIKVAFYTIQNMTKELSEEFIKRRNICKNRADVIHFYVCESEDNAYIIDIELR